jgi:hypothetical protein
VRDEFGEAIDAQDGIAVQRSQRTIVLLTLTLLLIAVSTGFAAEPSGAAVSGVVRDAQGVVQMGALVQVVARDSGMIGTAFTDLQGRYLIAHLLPGRYEVKASAALFIPAMRANLQLRSGAQAVVDLTLNTLFDTAAWLPAERRRADEPKDDWKWTLGAASNRPILRWSDDGDVTTTVAGAAESPRIPDKIHVAVRSGSGGFGESGVHTTLAVNHPLHGEAGMTLLADVGASNAGAEGETSSKIATGYEKRLGFAGETRTVISYQSHPELVSSGGAAGLESVQMSSGEKIHLGDMAEVEAGGTVYVVRSLGFASASRPFLKVSVHPGEAWTVGYRMATSRDLQGFSGLDTERQELPVAVIYQGRLQTERGLHQEFSVGRKLGAGLIQVAYYRDSLDRVMVAGGGALGSSEMAQANDVEAGSVVEDASTGNFRFLGNGYKTQGVNITLTEPVNPRMWVALEYSTGAALTAKGEAALTLPNAMNYLTAQTGQSATIALKGDVVRSGTSMRAAYRWQPGRMVTAVDPYAAFSDQAYFSCYLRQAIRMGNFLPAGLDATVDVTNLLAQGYRPFLSADGQTLFLAQSPRTVQAGLAFTF